MSHTPYQPTRQVMVGAVAVGGGAPISIQSMATTPTTDVRRTVDEIKRMEDAGVDIARVSVPDIESVRATEQIVRQIGVPLVADIHFNYRMAIEVAGTGIAKLRINPGNIGSKDRVAAVVQKAKEYKLPIRIGVNGGSLEKDLLMKYGFPTPEAMVESAFRHIAVLEEHDFHDIIVSLKASHVPLALAAYRLFARKSTYPRHIGITESGPGLSGAVVSSVGLGILLHEGIGDTMRVSLAADVVDEVKVAQKILQALHIQSNTPRIIACPTCARNRIDLFRIAEEVEKRTAHLRQPINIAVMGCAVNGPGEAAGADIGIAAGDGEGLIYLDGKISRKVKEEDMVEELMKEIEARWGNGADTKLTTSHSDGRVGRWMEKSE
ncbi:MAG TPA: flavodoxin-dependent (E)-4-hydroxy-3-methylbut-2-enyl-diphosphate synthase [Candidatus Krumholzibacteria bacterium]|nr:flavodoxin-dependent (E)-4-hydroxy-3-methylbut-2-enyl-diphosphate synthase [Candidatus Krumholzibacteria bacterium]